MALATGSPPLRGPQPALRLGKPLWLPPSNLSPRFPRLVGHHDTSVAVVGGGMTGALVAEAFASAGVNVTVLEESRIGAGSTVASSALLMQEPDTGLTGLSKRYGGPAAQRIWTLCREATHDLVGRLTRLRIACDLRPRDVVYLAATPDAVRPLLKEFHLRTRVGGTDEWLDASALHRLTGVVGAGAIRARGGAQFDPYRACRGLIGEAAKAGASVYEHSAVNRIVQGRHRVRLHTPTGSVTADRVVIATGYATRHFRPLAGRFRMWRTYVAATEPVMPAQRSELGLGDVMVWDTHRPYHYARWTADHRLLFGGADRRVRPGSRRDYAFSAATRDLRRHFEAVWPGLAGIETEFIWEGLFALTPDALPYIGPHRRYPRHWFALGYGGNGLTFASLAARLLLELWRGGGSDDQTLFGFSRLRNANAAG
jgi:glycine/D-amino acid oxidase-like deaminating enzyme